MLEFKNITFKYEEDTENILENLSFTAASGAFISIIGVSGCGKSTIFRLANQLLKPVNGEILIHDKPISQKNNNVGYMPQKDLLFPWRTVEKNLWLPMEIHGCTKSEMEKRSAAILEEMGLAPYKDKYPQELSGGMRQRISFARTLLTGAELMLLDEPFSALDSLTRMNMQEWLLAQWEHFHKTILFITHDVEEALLLSQKIFVINDQPIRQFEEISVPSTYPRSRNSLKAPEMIELKEQLIAKLRRQVTYP